MKTLDTMPLVKAFIEEKGFVNFQLESFNNFVETRLQKITNDIGQIAPEVPEIGELIIKFGKVNVGEPCIREADGTKRKIFPSEARIRDLTYAAPILVEMIPIVNKIEQEPVMVELGDIPIMVKSSHCSLHGMKKEELEEVGEDPEDMGGYFIINGTERVLILTEEIVANRMILKKQTVGNFTELIRINSEKGGYTQRHMIERKNDGTVYISFANIRRLPIVVLFKALGAETDKEIIDMLHADEKIAESFYINLYETEVQTSKEAIEFIGNHIKIESEYAKQRVGQLLDKYFMPHLGQDVKARQAKIEYLALAVKKIIEFGMNIIPEDDLDHFANKRVKMSGDLLELLIRSILIGRWGLLTRIKYNYQKMAKRGKLPPIQTIVEANVVSNQLVSAMGTGAWVGGRTGVSQRLDRSNMVKSISHVKMILSPLTSTQEHFEARELHPTHWGRFCPAETPEGPTIGLRKHLALLAEVTRGLSENDKESFKKKIKLDENGKIKVFLDGIPLGVSTENTVNDIIKKRREGSINSEVNVGFYKDLNEIRINTDSGRVRRPLVIIENGKPKLTKEHVEKIEKGESKWNDLVKEGAIEFLDADEEDGCLVALNEDYLEAGKPYTHVEITPLSILGVSASLLPFSQFNRGDRVNYGAKMIGQAIGIFQSNFLVRSDTKSNILVYPQEPLVQTQTTNVAGLKTHPSGQNIVLAVMTYHGYNIQDAIVFNKASIERGLFRSIFYRTYNGEERRYWGGQEDTICMPEKDIKGYRSETDYANLAEDGVLPPETVVIGRDILIGKISPMRFLSSSELMGGISNMRESSVDMRPTERGIVDRVFLTETVNGNKLVKVSVRDQRIPEVGDKFASRHGQKSVIGLIVNEEDMPFTASGHVPDLIFNPHSIPSRQTVGQLLEMISGKVDALKGSKSDATPFSTSSEVDEHNIKRQLNELGFRSDGKEVMYNGITGEKYEVEIFIGMNYFQKLDHMVANKIQARSRGPVTLLTRQPTEGKAKEGGLRLGEMEKDCLIAHGAVLTLKERFDSDKITVPLCRKCGITAVFIKQKGMHVCPVCKGTDIANIDMSYAFKLLLDELKSMLIYPKVNVY